MVPGHQILVGVVSAAVCLLGLIRDRWFLEHTAKGRALARRFGDAPARGILRALFTAGIVFGTLLATGVVNPIQWD